MITVWRSTGFREGRWLNGMGVSWDIAAEPPEVQSTDFQWRFAIARIDADVPFSHYTDVDRVFTLIEGEGLTLDVEGHAPLLVDRKFVPHAFPGDVPTSCKLKSGTCCALNLFLARASWSAEVEIARGAGRLSGEAPALFFALDGDVAVDGNILRAGDAALAAARHGYDAGENLLYVARLHKKT